MIAGRWRRLKTLFHDGVEMPPGERDALVARITAADQELGAELASLLAADDPSASRLMRPLIARSEALLADDPDAAGTLGPYRLIRAIGRGGVSTVFLAARADDHYHQRVAVKVIQRGLDAQEIQRFHQERQILAGLDHPNIARLLDGGTMADGRPYLVMEHIEGWHIDDYCTRHRLELEERLQLFLAVVRAVSYAHRHRVVHRDIKPSNVLVTVDGVPKLLDFGIAKLLDPSLSAAELVSTRPSLQRMTAGYASPEQARGEPVTEASDVYALGVLLYELLTSRPPFVGDSPVAVAYQHVREEPQPPSTHDPELPPEVDAIVMASLAKRVEDRYQSAADMRDDIDRYLAGEPVLAAGMLGAGAAATQVVPPAPPADEPEEPEEEGPPPLTTTILEMTRDPSEAS